MDLDVPMLFVHLAHRPASPDEMAERARPARGIARKRFRSAVDQALAGHRGADDGRQHAKRAVGFDTTLRLEAVRVIKHVGAGTDLCRLRDEPRFRRAGRGTARHDVRVEAGGTKRLERGIDRDAGRFECRFVEPRRPVEEPLKIAARPGHINCLRRRLNAGASDPDVNLHQRPNSGQTSRRLDGIDRHRDTACLRQCAESRQFLFQNRKRDQHIIAGQYFGFTQLGHRDSDRAGAELHSRDFRNLVGLHVRAEIDFPPVALLLHPADVALEDVQIDIEGRCVELQSIHLC